MEFEIEGITVAQCQKILKNPMLIDEWFFVQEDSNEPPKPIKHDWICLGRSWHGIHFLINQDGDTDMVNPPGSYAVFGKHLIEAEYLGVTCKYLLPEEAREVFHFISKFTKKDLSAIFNPQLMNQMGIYPRRTWTDGEFDSLYEVFEELVNFYRVVSKKKKCTLNIFFY